MRKEPVTVSSLDLTCAQLALGTLQSDRLPALATELLVQGVDSPSLRVLAGWTQPSIMSDVGPVLERALQELGLAPLMKQEALRIVARNYAQAIVSGQVGPYQGARLIWNEVSHDYEPFYELSVFVGLPSEIEDYEQHALSQPVPYLEYIESCVRDIQVAAQEFLNRVQPVEGSNDDERAASGS